MAGKEGTKDRSSFFGVLGIRGGEAGPRLLETIVEPGLFSEA